VALADETSDERDLELQSSAKTVYRGFAEQGYLLAAQIVHDGIGDRT